MAAASSSRPLPMASLSHSHSLSRLRLSPAYARFRTTTTLPSPSPSSSSCASSHTRFSTAAAVPCAPRVRVRVSSPTDSAALNATWLASLSSPLPRKDELGLDSGEREGGNGCKPEWIIGVDPDVSGALALLRPDGSGSPSGYSAQVFDSPFVKVMVGKSLRKRLDPRSMVELLHSFNAPIGTTAYIEQSTPFPQDGKQGWWSGGFGYGMWLGVLVASGFSVKPISSVSWKNFFELSRSSSTKDDSRRVASDMFPSLAPELKRKKDHGRAEALLIAAYGRSLTQQSNENYSLTEAKELQVQLC